MKSIPALFLAALVSLLVACGDTEYEGSAYVTAEYADQHETSEIPRAELSAQAHDVSEKADPTSVDSQTNETSVVDRRKIIYNADIDLVVDEFEGVPARVQALAARHGGFIANSRIRGSEGEPRTGTWTLRIASQNYDPFLTDSKSLGQVREVTTGTREVTAEFVDLQARLRNLEAEESRMNKHLQESTGKLDDILKVEREISRVRGEIERHQGRLNVLKDLTALSTVTLTVQEIKDYTPEPTEEPGFATQIARTWGNSIDRLGDFLKHFSLAIIALVPWLLILLPVGIAIGLVIRRVLRIAKKALTTKPPATSQAG